MTDMGSYNGPLHFQQAVANLNDTSNMDTVYSSDEAEAEARDQRFKAATVHAGLAQVAALVMLAEVVCTATNTDHPELDAWREELPLDRDEAPESQADDFSGVLTTEDTSEES